tara:strand:+ start:350 stop:739 length:390 start_codon:yes stop_codon:yes gene_type:complete
MEDVLVKPTRDHVNFVNRNGDFKFVTHNHVKDIDVMGTSLMGYLKDIDFYRLIEVFGRPHDADGYKSDAGWDIEFDDGEVATIYNWKNGLNYVGAIGKHHGMQLTDMTEWNVGGRDDKVVDRLMSMLDI